jgi:glycosyltransferase involved in cell wall biosynthesis
VPSPAASVIIPVYNSERFIATAVESVLAQSFDDFELLLIDDESTDRSIAICRGYRDPRVRIISQENRGPAGARNTGIREARGRYIAFLDSDDAWMPDKLERHVDHLKSTLDLGVSYSYSAIIDAAGRLVGNYQMLGANPTPLALCVTRHPVGNGSSAVVRADVFDPGHPNCTARGVEYLFFDEDLRHSEDFELWVRIATQTRWRMDCIPAPLTLYRIHTGGLSSDIATQRGYHYLALVKIFEYAPELIESFRTASIANLYWRLARILLLKREPRKALLYCQTALRFDASTFGVGGFLLIAASVLQRLSPPRIYFLAERLTLRGIGKLQELSMRSQSRA